MAIAAELAAVELVVSGANRGDPDRAWERSPHYARSRSSNNANASSIATVLYNRQYTSAMPR